MRAISAGEADSSYDKPCYWDEDELDKEQVRGRLPFLVLATHSQIPASAYPIWLDSDSDSDSDSSLNVANLPEWAEGDRHDGE